MVTYSYPRVTYSDPKVTHSDPSHLPLPPPASAWADPTIANYVNYFEMFILLEVINIIF